MTTTTTQIISVKGDLFKITLIEQAPKVPASLKFAAECNLFFINHLKN